MELIILAVLGGLSMLAGFGLDRLLKRRLKFFPEDRVFIIPGFFRQPLLLVVLALIPLEIILPLAWLLGPENGVGFALGLGLPALLLPLLAFALMMLWVHYGAVILTQEGVWRYYLIGHREIPYQELLAVEQKTYFLTPVTSVDGCTQTIRFPRQIQKHPELYLALCDQLQANRKALGVSPGSGDDAIDFPFEFGISPRRLMWERVAFVLLMLIFAVLATLGIWIQLSQGLLLPFTLESFFIIALFFIPFASSIPLFATSPALVIVGALMLKNVKQLDWNDPTEWLPAFVTLLLIPLTYSVANGIAVGYITYCILKLVSGRVASVHPLSWFLAALFLVKFLF